MTAVKTLLEITIYSWVLFIAIMLIKRLIKKVASPTLQYLIWFLLIARLCIPITISSNVQLFRIPDLKSYTEQKVQNKSWDSKSLHNLRARLPEPKPGPIQKEKRPRGVDGNRAVSEPFAPNNQKDVKTPSIPRIEWQQLVIAIWLVGMGSILSFFILTQLKMNKKLRDGRVKAPKELIDMVDRCREKLGIKRPIAIYVMDNISSPALTVSWRPKLILPISMVETAEKDQLLFSIGHELTHLKAGDHLVSLLLRILEAVYWFNPIVWIASKKILMDMESACDSRLVKTMGKDEKKNYAGIILEMFSENRESQFILGMAMGGTKNIAEGRIRGIFMRSKTKLRMRMLVGLIGVALIFSCFTTACQPTPENPTVVGKGDGKLERVIQSEPEPKEDEAKDKQVQEPIMSKLKDSFRGADEKVNINIDADVLIPSGNMPVIEVKPHYIDMERVKSMAEVLFHGNTAYEAKSDFSKEDLEKEILNLKKIIGNEEAMLEYYSGEREIMEEVKAEYEQRIFEYEELYEDAPNTSEMKETDWKFKPKSNYRDMVIYGKHLEGDDEESQNIKKEYNDSDMISLDSKIQDYQGRLTTMNSERGDFIEHYAIFSIGSNIDGSNTPSWDEANSKPMTMTQEEAISMVEDALDDMGINNMELSRCHGSGKPQPSVNLSHPGATKEAVNIAATTGEGRDTDEKVEGGGVYSYYMYFAPTYEGIKTHDMFIFDYDDYNQYGPSYLHEELRVGVSNGFITEFYWNSPMEQVRVENDNVSILSLEEAIKTFKKQMQLEFTLHRSIYYGTESQEDYEKYDSNIESLDVTIKEIELALIRIRVKDQPGVYRMVPAWVFSGNEQLNDKRFKEEGSIPDVSRPYTVINAIDGSIMDVSQGY